MCDLIEKLKDLLTQATLERSHYYTASLLKEAITEIERLTFLHDLDHKLADQWQKKNEELIKERDNLIQRLKMSELIREGEKKILIEEIEINTKLKEENKILHYKLDEVFLKGTKDVPKDAIKVKG